MTISTEHEWPYPGARWWKFDFHTHTPASADYGKGGNQDSLRQITPEDWLLGFMRAEVDCVAVTDHNSGEWVDKLKEALKGLQDHPDYCPLHLFPGVEITANAGIHLLALFDTAKGSADINGLLGAVRYKGVRGQGDRAADASVIEVVKAIAENGAIAIPAHVDGPSGAWGLPGSSLGSLLDCSDLFAIEVVDPASDPPELYRQRKLAWAEVLGSDSHHPALASGERTPGSHSTWVKMSVPSLEGLRLALLDGPGFSIRRSDDPDPFDPNRLPTHYIESIEISDARFMGRGEPARIEFSPWLNALVGGRGTGKSTVVHGLRLASRRHTDLTRLDPHSPVRRTFERFDRLPSQRSEDGGLRASTAIRWTVVRDEVRHRVHWRQEAKGVVVEEEAGAAWQESPVQSVNSQRFPLRIFNQGQIAELAGDNQQALLGVIDDAADTNGPKRKLAQAVNAFQTLRARVRELMTQLQARDGLEVERQDTHRKLSRFEEAGHQAVLATYQRRRRQRRELERQFETAEEIAGRIEARAEELLPEDLPAGTFDDSPEDAAAATIIADLASSVEAARQELPRAAARLSEALAAQRRALADSTWTSADRQAEDDYDALVRDLQAEGVADPSEYGRLTQDRQRLDGELADLDSLAEERDRLATQARESLDRVLDCRRAVTAARAAFLAQALTGNRFVRISIRPYGDEARVVERSMRDVLNVIDNRFQSDILTDDGGSPRGSVVDLLADLPESDDEHGREMEQRIAQWKKRVQTASAGGNGRFGGAFSNYLERETKRSPALLDGLLAWFPEDGLRVEYSPTGDGTGFRPISQASAGQRAAAMLAFLLAHGDEPLVLDQPEDDLDNHLIYDLVVRQIRENKRRRQIVVVTHNPNVVVNGDAEMLHALDFRNGQCVVTQRGSLQESAMREEVCRIMEGGREAFERRYRRLGQGRADVR